jgi:Mg-chelatase subunit ChlD
MKGPALTPETFLPGRTQHPCCREQRSGRGRHTLGALGTALVLCFISFHIAVPIVHSQETIDDLYKLFKVEEIRSDFVILLDTSGSMQKENRYQNARNALESFLEVPATGDYLSIITFDNLPTLWIPKEASPNFKSILNQIPAAPNPKGDTAIGLALEMALQELDRPAANQSQFVFFLTDGKDEHRQGVRHEY